MTDRVECSDHFDRQLLLWQRFFALSQDLLCRIDKAGFIMELRGVWDDVFGYTEGELLGSRIGVHVHQDDASIVLRAAARLRQGASLERHRVRFMCRGGGFRTLDCRVSLMDEDYYVVARDITEQVEAVQRRSEAERMMHSILSSLPGMAYRCNYDPEWTMQYVSEGSIGLTGYAPADLVGNAKVAFNQIIDPPYREHLWKRWAEVLERREALTEEYTITTSTGETVWVWEQGRGVYSAEGDVIALEGLLIDITEKRQAEIALRENESMLRSLVESMDDMVFTLDKEGRHTMLFGEWGSRPDWDNSFLLGKTMAEVFGAEEAAIHDEADQRVLAGESVVYEWSEGAQHYQTSLSPLRGPGGEVVGIVGVGRNVTPLKQRAQELYEEKERLRITLKSIGDGVISTDASGRVVMLNDVAAKMTGWAPAEAEGKPLREVLRVYQCSSGEFCDLADIVLGTGETVELQDATLRTKAGEELQIADSAAPIKDVDGSITGMVIVFRDVTEERRRQEEIVYMSYHDSLTKLYNRTYFEEVVKQLDKEENLPVSLIVGDVNGLKVINDVFGHEEGDKALKQIAQHLSSCVSTLNEGGIVVRLGGDEFVVLLPETPESKAVELCRVIEARLTQLDAGPVQPSISLGYASRESVEERLDQVFKVAEDRMYRRKLLEGKSLRSSVVSSLKDALFERSNETEGHAERVGHLCKLMGVALGLSGNYLDELRLLSTLHDLGKIAIKDSILLKPGPLSPEEWVEMKKHPEVGYRIAQSVYELASIAEYILSHHERWDGSGYPIGLGGTQIPLLSRILAIADAYDVMTNPRPYKAAVSHEEALSEIRRCAATQFDPSIVDVFLQVV